MEAQASLEEMEVEDVDDRFQKPNKYLKFLPISHDALETDADRFYKHVKDKLTSAILLQDIKQGAKFWAQQFQRYIFTPYVLLLQTFHSLFLHSYSNVVSESIVVSYK